MRGSIPACAGKPELRSLDAWRSGVHPRVCGEAANRGGKTETAGGPSPRVRGSLGDAAPTADGRGSIPACAGKPSSVISFLVGIAVHPRVCGEAFDPLPCGLITAGPSPRVRGSPARRTSECQRFGSIPACAGKPQRSVSVGRPRQVHPRVCGEAAGQGRAGHAREGPSPRVRGSRSQWRGDSTQNGSIPACAGKPTPGSSAARRWRVHPRVCGEALLRRRQQIRQEGPSPRVRGSPP